MEVTGEFIMVDSIHGPGKRIIITTKPKAKESVDKKSGFDDAMKGKTTGGDKAEGVSTHRNPAANNLKIMQQQQLMHMQRLDEITKQVQNGTYKMVSPEVLAEKIYQVLSDRGTREKFIKKLLQEEAEKITGKGKNQFSELELKKLVFLIKEVSDEEFDDPELESLIKEYS
jgi:anti-sigma28 factor (negative regulator of flagellin synthesis)